MFESVEVIKNKCKEKNIELWELVLEEDSKTGQFTKEEIIENLTKMLEVMEGSANVNLDKPSKTEMGMIDGFAHRMKNYSDNNETITGDFITNAMAMAFSTLESSACMGKIVASPTAGSSGILPAALTSMKNRYNFSTDKLVESMLTAVGVGKIIGRYSSFAGAEGGCQAETGSGAAMAAGAITYLLGGDIDQIFNAASIAYIHVLGLVCDPIAGLVEYPCTFRNASGVVNAFISSDMSLAGIKSIVPFEQVCIAVEEVGSNLPESLRETGLGGLAGTDVGKQIMHEFLEKNKNIGTKTPEKIEVGD